MMERRAEKRLLDDELAMLSWEQDGHTYNQLANVLDVSLGGMCLLVDHPFPLESAVRVTYGEGDLDGIVRHNTETMYGNQCGIEFVGDSRNSILHFGPELLIRER